MKNSLFIRILTFLIIFCMVLGMAACNKNTSGKNENSEVTTSEITTSEENNSSNSEDISSNVSSEEITEDNKESSDNTVNGQLESTINNPAHTHSYTSKTTKPTCTSIGYTTHTCGCGHSYTSDRKEILGHAYTQWVTVKAATTSNTGLEERTCERCKLKDSRSIPKKVTTSNVEPVIDVTTDTWGNITYTLNNCRIRDKRTWGKPPYITVVDSNSMKVTYYNKNNEKVEFVATQPFSDEWLNVYTIWDDDGTWTNRLIGAYS